MKKLLALLLCVMMFAAIIPTNAFAWEDKAVSNTAIKEAEKSIKNMYTAIATDELVFGTAKSLYDLSNGLAENLLDDVDSFDTIFGNKVVYHDDLVKYTRKYLNLTIGNAIADYISKRVDTFKSDTINGGVDPEKYLKVFVAAVNDAVASEKAQKGLQAFVYDLYAIKTMYAVKDQAEDLQDAIKDWGSGKWNEFGSNFDALPKVYDQSFNTAYGIWSTLDGDQLVDPMTNPWAYTKGEESGAWDGNGIANIADTWILITNDTP